jgi:acetyl-CoA C-acetyltransferase
MVRLDDIVAVGAVRTPFGRFGGALRDVPVYDLGAMAIRAALERSGFDGASIAEVVFGSCRQAGNGPNPARTAMLRAGMPVEVPASTVNMACVSGMKSIFCAVEGLLAGRGEAFVSGGMDSMSTMPYLLKDCRFEGFRSGDRALVDGWSDSIDPICGYGMGENAEKMLERHDVSREEMDAFALESHGRAVAAIDGGLFEKEIVKVALRKDGARPAVALDADESPRRDTTLAKLAKLPPAFEKNCGLVTAGNACGMADGACALVLTTRERACSMGAKPLFGIVSCAQTAVDGRRMGEGPGVSVPMALARAGMTLADMDLCEINEAFAVQVIVNSRALGMDWAKLNVNGGAIALGHPTGVSGARIVVTLANALSQRDKELGVAAIGGGGGVTTAMVVRRES